MGRGERHLFSNQWNGIVPPLSQIPLWMVDSNPDHKYKSSWQETGFQREEIRCPQTVQGTSED